MLSSMLVVWAFTTGLRLEKEHLLVAQTKVDGFKNDTIRKKVVHCYSTGGNGYKLS